MMIMFSVIIMIIGPRGTETCFHKMTKNKGVEASLLVVHLGCAPGLFTILK